MNRLILTTLMALGVIGCSALKPYGNTTVQSGSLVTVNEALKSEGGARLYLQRGKVLSYHGVKQDQPWCEFFFIRPPEELDEQLVVNPGDFVVTGISQRREIASFRPVVVASAEPLQLSRLISGNQGGGSQFFLSTHIGIESGQQPQIDKLICKIWADPRDRQYVSVAEAEEALGELVTISPPPG